MAMVLGGLVALGAGAGVARADGEAGLVIQHGDGSVDTYCVAFNGDGISGKELLKRVNIPTEDVGGLVCAIGNNPAEGCFGASDYDSCTCKCSGSNAATCTYWAFFSAAYGKPWVYSSLGYTQLMAKDGDLQAWRWGRGGSSSAPPPPALTFEAVCGHAPRGGAAQSVQTATVAPAASNATAGAAVTASSTTEQASTATVVAPLTINAHGFATATPAPAVTAAKEDDGGSQSVVGFAVLGGILVLAISAGAVWRARRGG